ncbi:MAG: heme-binding protein [Mycolicibacterium sp.]|nr:heme-binding protein [Mycobacterium sp.]MCB9416419.1 heme-binding protein [Mycolicibacterium sp.]
MIRVTNRTLVRILALGGVVGALGASPAALADPAPNCTAADRAGISAGVQAATSAYLFAHPDVNEFMTGLAGQPVDEVPAVVQDYLNANPQIKAEVQSIRQPLADMRERCGPPLLNQE